MEKRQKLNDIQNRETFLKNTLKLVYTIFLNIHYLHTYAIFPFYQQVFRQATRAQHA